MSSQRKRLEEIFLAHKGKVSDKWALYIAEYEKFFHEYRDRPVKLLEIGVQNGGSLEIWAEYFTNGSLFVGCDSNPCCGELSFEDPRIILVIGDINDDSTRAKILSYSREFDIVIDDGSHHPKDIIQAFLAYYPILTNDGLYIIEDLHTSYWKDFEGGLFNPFSALSFFKRLVDIINFEHWGVARSPSEVLKGFQEKYGITISNELLQHIHSITFVNSLCIIRKSRPVENRLGPRIVAGQKAPVFSPVIDLNGTFLVPPPQTSNLWSSRARPPEEEVLVLEAEKEQLDQELKEKERALQELSTQLAEREKKLQALQVHITEIRKRISQLEAEREDLGRKLEEKGKALQELNSQLAEREKKLQALQMRTQNLDRNLSILQQRMTWKRYRLADILAGWYWLLRHPKSFAELIGRRVKRFHRKLPTGWRGGLRNEACSHLALLRKAFQILLTQGPASLWRAYVRYQKHLKIRKQTLSWSRPPGGVFCLSASEFAPLGKSRIAVVIHAYYPDVFEELCLYLTQIPVKYSLFVSVKNEDDKATVIALTKRLPRIERLEVKIVPNRGRDIAPLLVAFARTLRNYDYICHLHTKKSLRTGSEQVSWRRYLYDMLLGTEERVRAILSLFEKDPSIGIVYPEAPPDAPYWGFTWLGNKPIASDLLHKLGLKFDPDEYIDFPVGSMFWARREALEPLLELGLTWKDFPEERGQTDGTLHHTIERSFVLAAQSKGFKQAVIVDREAHRFSYRSHRNFYHYLGASFEEKVQWSLSQAKVVSFDVFDTLLIRPFSDPDAVFNFLQERVAQVFGLPRYRELRKRAETLARARRNFTGDVKISEIYSAMAELAKINDETANRLLNLEVETEKKLLVPRTPVVEIARKLKSLGKRIILVSDTYLEREHLKEILHEKGIDFYDAIYISCEEGKRKDRGDLWEHVLSQEGIAPSELLHIGDNEESDVHVLEERGFLHPVHVMRPSVLFRQSSLGERLWEVVEPWQGWRENVLYGMWANLFCVNPVPKDLFESREPLSDPFKFGYSMLGPIILTFLNWLVEMVRNDGIEMLRFITREGYFLDKAYRLLTTHEVVRESGLTLPEGDYFVSSRRAVLFAALRSKHDIPRLLERHFQGTLRAFFEKRLNVADLGAIEQRLGRRALAEKVSLPHDYTKVFARVAAVFDILAKQAEQEREALLKYCQEQGISDPSKRVGLVDLGYSATIQKTLSDLLELPLAGYYFVTDAAARKLTDLGLVCRACFGEFVDPLTTDNPFKRYSLLLEAVLTAPTGQLLRFESGPTGQVKPVYKEAGVSQKALPTIQVIHDGILAFIRDMANRFGAEVLKIRFSQNVLEKYYEDLVLGRLKLGALESVLSVEDQFCGNDEIPVLDFYRSNA